MYQTIKFRAIILPSFFYALLFISGFEGYSQNVKLEWLAKPSLTYYKVYNFVEGMAKVAIHSGYKEQFGFVNSKGKEIIPTKYDYASDFKNGVAIIGKDREFGLVNHKGKVILPVRYEEINKLSDNLFRVKTTLSYGFADITGKLVIGFEYDYASDFYQGLAVVKAEGKYGCINKQNKPVFEFKYDDLEISEFDDIVLATLNNKIGLYRLNKEVIYEPQFDELEGVNDSVIKVKKNGKYALMNRQFKMVSDYNFEFIARFGNSQSRVVVYKNRKYGLYNTITQKLEIPMLYREVKMLPFGHTEIGVNGKVGIFDNKSGKEIIPPKYENVEVLARNLYGIYDSATKKYILVNAKGEQVSKYKYSWLRTSKNGFAKVGFKHKYTFINTQGKEITPPQFDYIDDFKEGRAEVKLNGKRGFIDTTGKIVIPIKFNKVYNFQDGLAKVFLNNKWGLIKPNNVYFITPQYRNADPFRFCNKLLAKVTTKRNESGLMNKNKKFVIPPKFDVFEQYPHGIIRISNFVGSYSFVRGLWSCKGEKLLDQKYQKIKEISDNKIWVQQDEKWGILKVVPK